MIKLQTGFRRAGPARHLVIFVRKPVLGRVKTRLARDIGAVSARRFYRQMTDLALFRLGDSGFVSDPAGSPGPRRWQCWLFMTPENPRNSAGFWPDAKGWRLNYQSGQGLGQRMLRALGSLPPGPAVLIGSDIPAVQRNHIARAFQCLERGPDMIFGPAEDGGFWLIGSRNRKGRGAIDTRCLNQVRWSGPHALTDSEACLARQGFRSERADRLPDIDQGRDLQDAQGKGHLARFRICGQQT